MTKTKMIGGVVAAAALLAPAIAGAQDVGPFDPLGVRAGAFLVYPSLTASGEYDDNIFATADDEEDDFIFRLRPELRAQSQWSRHSLTASAFGEFGFFADENDSNYQDFGTALDGRLDATRDSSSTGRLAVSRLHEDRDAPDDVGEDDVTQFWLMEARLAHRHNFARFFVRPSVYVQRLDFESAGDLSNTERDRNRYGAGVRGGMTISPRLNVFVETNGDIVEYDSDEADRDSTGFDVRGGVEIDISRLVIGEASLGYARRSYDDDDLDTAQGVAGDAGITWTPTQLTTVDFTGRVNIEETTVFFEGDRASGNLATRIGVGVTHELRRNILLNANAGYDRDNFRGTDRVDDTFRLGGGVSYLLNRNLSVNASYSFSTRDSDDDNEEFDRNIFRIGVTARL